MVASASSGGLGVLKMTPVPRTSARCGGIAVTAVATTLCCPATAKTLSSPTAYMRSRAPRAPHSLPGPHRWFCLAYGEVSVPATEVLAHGTYAPSHVALQERLPSR